MPPAPPIRNFADLDDVPAGDGVWARVNGVLVWKPLSDFDASGVQDDLSALDTRVTAIEATETGDPDGPGSSSVGVLIGPLFPDLTFADSDRVYVEHASVAVGPSGGQARAAAEEIWPGVTFSDDDTIVVETSRKFWNDNVALPGDITTDDFDGASGAALNSLVWQANAAVTLDGAGHASFPASALNAIQLVNAGHFVNKKLGLKWATDVTSMSAVLRAKHEASPTTHYDMVTMDGTKIKFLQYSNGGTSVEIVFDPVAHAYWQIRSADQMYFETSPDGVAWTVQATRSLPSWVTTPADMIYEVQVGPNTGVTLLDKFWLEDA